MAFGWDDAIGGIISIIDKAIPDPVEAAKAKNELVALINQVRLGQIEVNKEEAKQPGLFSKWRPAIGWGLASSIWWQFIIYPFMVSIILICDEQFPVEKLPVLDMKSIMALATGMLGVFSGS